MNVGRPQSYSQEGTPLEVRQLFCVVARTLASPLYVDAIQA